MIDLKSRRMELGLTLLDVAKAVGVSEATISRYENGNIKSMKNDRIEKYAKILMVNPTALIESEFPDEPPSAEELAEKFSNIKPVKLKKFPLLGNIACGKPIFADEDKESCIMADMDINADFCLTAQGDSMINARIYDGDIVFIKEMPIVDNGEIAAVIIDDEATLKRVYYYHEKGKLILSPENPKYEPFVYVGEELNNIRILGKAVYFMSAL